MMRSANVVRDSSISASPSVGMTTCMLTIRCSGKARGCHTTGEILRLHFIPLRMTIKHVLVPEYVLES